MNITAKNGEQFTFRLLQADDGELLGCFFEGLSEDTRSKFGPHPLNIDYAQTELCSNVGKDNVSRYIICSAEKVIGYFIVDFNEYPHEQARYNSYEIDLDFSIDPVFAPCIADDYQSQGVASQAVNAIIGVLRDAGLRSLVLMGGTQAPNSLARHFYRKLGFEELGEFFTEHNGLNNIDMRLEL